MTAVALETTPRPRHNRIEPSPEPLEQLSILDEDHPGNLYKYKIKKYPYQWVVRSCRIPLRVGKAMAQESGRSICY
jgi:hypothetical protein